MTQQALCFYCRLEILKDEPGWGWGDDMDQGRHFLFHCECLEICEGVIIA